MCKVVAYMRISTDAERKLQKFSRQEHAIDKWCAEHNVEITERHRYRDDASGKSFDRPSWKELETDLVPGDTIVFKDICRFTRECENGYKKYMELMNKGINMVFLDNPTISTEYIKNMIGVASKQENRIAKKSLNDTIELLILVELDRAEREREITVQRIKDGIAASDKKSGRKEGSVAKLTDELRADIKRYISDRSVQGKELMDKHGISRNTLKKYVEIVKSESNQ